jgi:hypothetical protein
MKLTIPDICSIIRLADYAPEFGDAVIHVWVNPPRYMFSKKLESAADVYAFYSELWSHGPEDSRISAEDVQALAEAATENDPNLWAWLMSETARLIVEHRKKKPKN